MVDIVTVKIKNIDIFALLFGGAAISFFMASVAISGWPDGLNPNISFPYIYAGDAIYQHALIQRSIEGWVFTNDRQGFPFGSEWYDFPSSDSGNIFVSKLLSMLFGSYFAGENIYTLLGFSVTFSVSFYVLRQLGVRNSLSFSSAIIFAFAPYHFARMLMGHTFYTWYFAVPLYFYCGYLIYKKGGLSKVLLGKCCIAVSVTACFGVYFALFGVITIMLCGLTSGIKTSTLRPILSAFILGMVIVSSVAVNVAPNLIFWLGYGKNTQVAQRSPISTEVYSLKPIHLLLPPPNHRITSLAKFSQWYASAFPLSNTVSSVGFIGLIGLMLIAHSFIKRMAGKEIYDRIGLLTVLIGGSLIISTVGGLNVLFSIFVSPLIRGWDRFSIFIFFYVIAALAYWLSAHCKNYGSLGLLVIAAVTCLALLDQTPESVTFTSVTNKSVFLADRELVSKIEKSLPRGASIYQIPYMEFPEAATLHKLGTYDQLTGFLNSKELKWSSGGMLGRGAMTFFKKLSEKTILEQVEVVKSMGFSGIYVQHRGYADGGVAVVAELTKITGKPPALTRSDGAISFFRLR